MNIAATMANLRKLRMSSMAQALQHQLEQPGTYNELSFVERLDLLVDDEFEGRRQRKQ